MTHEFGAEGLLHEFFENEGAWWEYVEGVVVNSGESGSYL
jgi:hypothetical protein